MCIRDSLCISIPGNMPNLIFITDLNHKDKEGLIPIKANISIGKTNYRKTIARAKPRYWDEKTKNSKKPKKTETDKPWIEIYEKLEYLKKNSESFFKYCTLNNICLLYTSDAADEEDSVDL